MNASDAVMWDIERDPELRSTVVAVALLHRAPDWGRLVQRLEVVAALIARLHQRVVVPALPGALPAWVEDEAFDLSYHVRRVEVPGAGSLDDVLELARPLAMAAFDPARPLWEFTLVEGMEGGQAALIQKFHHTLTDGMGAVELALTMLDGHPDDADPLPPAPDASPPPGGDLVASARAAMCVPVGAFRSVLGTVGDPFGSGSRALRMARSIARTVAPVPPSASTLLTGRSLGRRFHAVDIPLADLKAAARLAGGTVNDAFLASVVEGLRRYHVYRDAEVGELRLTMPINLRRQGDPMGGNHFAPVRFTVPTTIADPVERMRQLGATARAWEQEPALLHSDTIANALHRLPVAVTTQIFGGMLKHVDAVVTNVPGIQSRCYLAGAEVDREYAFAPTAGAAINISLVSHGGTACIGVVTDTAAIPDDGLLVRCLVEGFDEVVSAVDERTVADGVKTTP